VALRCPSCRSKLLWWDLKPAFPCPACDTRLEADIRRAWLVTVLLWLAVMMPLIAMAARDADGPMAFALALGGPICVLSLGYAIGSRVFRRLAIIRSNGL